MFVAIFYNIGALVPTSHTPHWLRTPVEILSSPGAHWMSQNYHLLLTNREEFERLSGAVEPKEGVVEPEFPCEILRTFRAPAIPTEDEIEDLRTSCRQAIMLNDVFRVTSTNIILVTLLAIALYITTRNEDGEVRRKWYDSLYFFGFILTLLALIMALGNVARFSGVSLTIIVVQNAIALSSTVVALITRTLLVLTIPVEMDNDEKRLTMLNKQITDLTNKLKAAGTSVGEFDSQVATTKDAISGIGDKIGVELAKVTDNLKAKADEISKIEIDKELIVNQMAEAVRLALKEVDTEIGSLTTTIQSGSSDVGAVITSLQNAINGLEKALGDGASTAKESATTISDAISNVVDASARSVERVTANAETMTAKLAELDLKEIVSGRLTTMLDNVATQISTEQTKLSLAVTKILETLGVSSTSHRDLAEATVNITEKVKRQHASLAALESAYASLQTRIDGTFADPTWISGHATKLNELRTSNDELKKALDEATLGLGAYASRRSASDVIGGLWRRFTRPFRRSP